MQKIFILVIEIITKKIIYRSSKFGKSGIYTFDTLDNIISAMIQDFISKAKPQTQAC